MLEAQLQLQDPLLFAVGSKLCGMIRQLLLAAPLELLRKVSDLGLKLLIRLELVVVTDRLGLARYCIRCLGFTRLALSLRGLVLLHL